MKKIIILLTIIIGLGIVGGCVNQNVVNDLDLSQSLIEKVKTIETLEHQFNNFFITYDEYVEGLEGLFIEIDTEDNPFVRIYIPHNKEMLEDLKNFTKEEIKEIRKHREESRDFYEIEYVKISDVYTEEDKNRKYVFTEEKHYSEKMDIESYFVKRYMFIEDNNEWLVTSVDMGYYDNTEFHKKAQGDRPVPYTRFNNERVNYTYEFKPIE